MSNHHRIDAFAKAVATRGTRRNALQMAGLGITAGLLGTSSPAADAQESTEVTSDAAPAFLFVQTAASGTFMPNTTAGSGADYLLTLEGHYGGTIYFSDRPGRIFGDTPTQEFFDEFGFTSANPPNAALVAETDEGETDVVILELLDPIYHEATGTITYGATILTEYDGEGLAHATTQQLDNELPASFGRVSLFIDSAGSGTYEIVCAAGGEFCTSIGGTALCGQSGSCCCSAGVDGETYCISGLMVASETTCGDCESNEDCVLEFGTPNAVCIAYDDTCNKCDSGGICAAKC